MIAIAFLIGGAYCLLYGIDPAKSVFLMSLLMWLLRGQISNGKK